jgi:hypothetical protein
MFPSDRRALRGSLALGAIYDILLALLLLSSGERILDRLGHPVQEPFFFSLAALPLLLLPVLYVAAARAEDLDEFRPPVLWARTGGGFILILFTLILTPGAAWIYLLVGGVDLTWAGVHFFLWRPPRSG